MCPCSKSEQSVDHILNEFIKFIKERKNYTFKTYTKNREVASDETYLSNSESSKDV